jgi:hypothetical protein
LGERGPLASAKAEPAVTTFNIDTSEPLPPEQWRRLPKGNSEKGVPSVPTNDPPNEKSEKGVAGVPGQLAEAQRIAGELVKLYHVGAISGPDDLEAVFYAHVIGAFGGAVLKNSPGQTLSAGEHPEPVDTVPEPPPVFRRKRGWNSTPTTWRPRLVRNTSITTISRRSFTPELHPGKRNGEKETAVATRNGYPIRVRAPSVTEKVAKRGQTFHQLNQQDNDAPGPSRRNPDQI